MAQDQPLSPLKKSVSRQRPYHKFKKRPGHLASPFLFFGFFLVVSLLVLNLSVSFLYEDIPLLEVKSVRADDVFPPGEHHPPVITVTPTMQPATHQHSDSSSLQTGPAHQESISTNTPVSNSQSHNHNEAAGHTHQLVDPGGYVDPSGLNRGVIVGWFVALNLSIILAAGFCKRRSRSVKTDSAKVKANIIHR